MPVTIATSLRHEGDRIKGSRFIVDIAPASDEQQAKQLVARVAADFPDASHHCSAWRLATPAIERANDDGEPSGSAGRPILAQLAGRELVDCAVVVTRYFGGTKLGVGGLMRAYGGAAGAALDTMQLVEWVAMTEVTFAHDYALTDAVERIVTELEGSIDGRSFAEVVTVRVRLPELAFTALAAEIRDLTAGGVELTSESNSDLPQ